MVILLCDIIICNVSLTLSTLKKFVQFWVTCFNFWLCSYSLLVNAISLVMATPDPCWWNVPMTFSMKNMLFKLTREIKYQAILINFCYILNTFFTTTNLNLKQTNLSITDNLFKFITQYKKINVFPMP